MPERVRLPPQPNGRFDLLEGTRVVDVTTSIAGPYATLLLADYGAEVLKIERPGSGDDSRAWGPPFLGELSLWFASMNRNKKSVALDFSTSRGKALLDKLITVSDVVVTSLKPSSQRKLGLDYLSLKKIRDDIIVCSITGFGLGGPAADLASYDLIAEGYSGVMDLTGEAGGKPQKIGTPAADLLAGMDAAHAVTAALFDRARHDRGHLIDISLLESMTKFLTPRLVSYLGSGEVPRRSGGRDSVIAVYQIFETKDRPITLGLGNDAIFARFCATVQRTDWADRLEYASNAARRGRRDELVAAIQEILATRSSAEWLSVFNAAGVPAGPVNRVDEVLCNPQLADRGFFYEVEQPDAESLPQVGTGWHLDGAPNGRASLPPRLGADTDAVLKTLAAVEASDLDSLRADGVIN